MCPTLNFFGIRIPTFGAVQLVAFCGTLWLASRLAKREGIQVSRILSFGIYLVLVTRGASVLLDSLVTGQRVSLAGFAQSSGSFFWVYLSGCLFALAYSRYHRIPLLRFLDCLSPSVVLAQAVGRLGCFAAGCCFGAPTASWLGVVYRDERARNIANVPLNVALHPTQLYESAAAVLILGFLLWLYPRRAFPGQIFAVTLGAISLARLIFESFRGDPARGFVFDGLSVPRLVAAVLLGVAIVCYYQMQRRASTHEDTVASLPVC